MTGQAFLDWKNGGGSEYHYATIFRRKHMRYGFQLNTHWIVSKSFSKKT